MQPFLTFLLFVSLINVCMQLNLTEDEMKLMKGKFCGIYLSDTLSELCDGEYNTVHKRSMNINGNKGIRVPDKADYFEEETNFPFRSKRLAKSIISARYRRSSRGIASECCHKPCSLWEMYGYCAARNGR